MEITTTGVLTPSERERILKAMAELCEERGYAATTIEGIAERAGVSTESFGALFSDREDCLVASVNAILGETMAAVSGSYSADRSEWDSALRGILAILELMAEKPAFAYLSFVTARQMSVPRALEAQEAGIRVLTAMIERLWEYADVDVQAMTVARGALGGAEAVVRREVAAGRAGRLPLLLPDFVYSATAPFLGQEEALRLAQRGRRLLDDTR
jgi:AcrR family transcriptional regulator